MMSGDNVETRTAVIELPREGFRLESGEFLHSLEIAYETYGELAPEKDNVIFICHALSGDAHVAGISSEDGRQGWWDEMVGPGKGIDTNLYFVICANILGGCKGTTGPSSVNPSDGRPYGSRFPKITVGDIVAAHLALLKHLQIDSLAAIVGGSFGGMQVLEWIIRYPDTVRSCICVASATSLSAQALAFDVVGRKAITSDPSWRRGDYYESGDKPVAGLAQARMIGHITYLSQAMMDEKFGREKKTRDAAFDGERESFSSDFQVESYLDYQGSKFVDRFDANSYLHITSAMDEFDLGCRYGGLSKAFAGIKSRILIVALSSDWLFPPEQSKEIANGLLAAGKNVSYMELVAPHGHDAFLVDIEHLATAIRAFLPWVGGRDGRGAAAAGCAAGVTPGASGSGSLDVARYIRKGARVLDLGCGNGGLLQHLAETNGSWGLGVDCDLEHVISVIDRGVNVFHSDIDEGLSVIPDDSYDVVVLNDILQAVKRPRDVLRETLRIAGECVVSFPNFGNWAHRLSLLAMGRMPKGRTLPFEWYNTPNIHLFTLKDFVDLCAGDNIKVAGIGCYYGCFLSRLLGLLGFRNAGADRVTVRICRAGKSEAGGKNEGVA